MFAIPNIEKIKIQLIIGAVVLTIVGLLCWATKHYYDLSIKKDGEIKELTQSNKTLNKDIDNLRESKKAADDTILAQRKVFENIDIVNKQHMTQTTDAVRKIMNKYSALPQTQQNLDARDKEVSTARIIGLWATYCSLEKEAADNKICDSFKKVNEK